MALLLENEKTKIFFLKKWIFSEFFWIILNIEDKKYLYASIHEFLEETEESDDDEFNKISFAK